MYRVLRTDTFVRWFDRLRDRMAKDRIEMRIRRLRSGNLGDWKSVGNGVRELRIDAGPGYRIYFGVRKQTIVILLMGGDKGTQQSDILAARALWKDEEDGQ